MEHTGDSEIHRERERRQSTSQGFELSPGHDHNTSVNRHTRATVSIQGPPCSTSTLHHTLSVHPQFNLCITCEYSFPYKEKKISV